MLSHIQVEYLISRGACILATTYSDNETAREKCEMDEEGYDGTSKSLYSTYHTIYIHIYAIYNLNPIYSIYRIIFSILYVKTAYYSHTVCLLLLLSSVK